jgi:hypothetical protein
MPSKTIVHTRSEEKEVTDYLGVVQYQNCNQLNRSRLAALLLLPQAFAVFLSLLPRAPVEAKGRRPRSLALPMAGSSVSSLSGRRGDGRVVGPSICA